MTFFCDLCSVVFYWKDMCGGDLKRKKQSGKLKSKFSVWLHSKHCLQSQNSRNQGFSYYFCLMIEGSGSGSIPPTRRSGSGSRRPKNIWIRRNTGWKKNPDPDPEQYPDPDPYLWLMDPDPGGPKTWGSGGSASGFGSGTLVYWLMCLITVVQSLTCVVL